MNAPNRRRPGSASPIKLVPEVEEVRTSTTAEPSEIAPPSTTEAATKAAGAPTLPMDRKIVHGEVGVEDDNPKRPVTFNLRTSLKKRAETAVLRTAGYDGGYQSMAALVDGALERELERLAIEFNDGEPFPRNAGGFRQGRPLGS